MVLIFSMGIPWAGFGLIPEILISVLIYFAAVSNGVQSLSNAAEATISQIRVSMKTWGISGSIIALAESYPALKTQETVMVTMIMIREEDQLKRRGHLTSEDEHPSRPEVRRR